MYKSGKPVFDYLSIEGRKTTRLVHNDFNTQLENTQRLLNAQFATLEQSAWTYSQRHFSGRRSSEPALISSLHKSVFLFYSAIQLNNQGLYGPARTLLRSIFEGQVIAKYSMLDHSSSVYEHWSKAKPIHITNQIFNRIKKPDIGELKYFWQSMHEMAHATIYAQQIEVEYPNTKQGIATTLSLIQILLCMNQHLLGRHFLTNATIRYTRMYSDEEAFEASRETARQLVKAIRAEFTDSGKRVVREYTASWKIKN